MSFVGTIQTDLTCIDTIRQAINRMMGREIECVPAKHGRIPGTLMADYTFPISERHSIGFTKQANGTFSVVADHSEVNSQYPVFQGNMVETLEQAYAVESLRQEIAAAGYPDPYIEQGVDERLQPYLELTVETSGEVSS